MKNPDPKPSTAEVADSSQRNDFDLDKLNSLLVGIDKHQANDVIERVQNVQKRGVDVHEVLIDAIIKFDAAERDLVLEQFSDATSATIKSAIKDDPEQVAGLIYPVMLPAIRAAVADAMRSSTERIDSMFKSKLSPESIKWRLEAKRSGVSYAEVLMRNTMQFGVEQAFLIDRKTGLLMQHVSSLGSSQKDEDAVSGMLLAIERFVNDSFGDDDEDLKRVTIGERLVYLAHGPSALLACVVKGVPPSDFLTVVQSTLEHIHAREPEVLKNFSGDRDTLNSINPEMSKLLKYEFAEESDEEGPDFNAKATIAMQCVGILLLGLLTYGWFQGMQEKRISQYVNKLNTHSNIQVFKSEEKSGSWILTGIIDPTGVKPSLIEQSAFVNEAGVDLNLTPVRFVDLAQPR